MDLSIFVRRAGERLGLGGIIWVTALALLGCCSNATSSTPPANAGTVEGEPVTSPTSSPVEASVQPKPEPGELSERYASVVASPDRSEADRALDSGRKPAQLLSFFGVRPGQRVAELGAGGGYTAELLARTVGPEGQVFGQNSTFLLERFAEQPWSARLSKPVMSNVVRVDRDFDSPLPPDVVALDAVFNVLFYHDTVWQGVDRTAMNRAIFAALAPGGVYGIVDHSAAAGAGTAVTQTLHRIEESVVVREVEAAGFELEARADFLRNPEDTRDWNAAPSASGARRGTSDRFVLLFRKPR